MVLRDIIDGQRSTTCQDKRVEKHPKIPLNLAPTTSISTQRVDSNGRILCQHNGCNCHVGHGNGHLINGYVYCNIHKGNVGKSFDDTIKDVGDNQFKTSINKGVSIDRKR